MSIKKRIFFTLILLSLLPLALISILTALMGEEILKRIVAQHYMVVTQEKANAISRILDDRINETRLLSEHPAVIAAVKAANLQYQEREPEAVLASILRQDKAWIANKGETETARSVAGHPLSDTLKKIQTRRAKEYGEMFVTDQLGATVAMTKTLSDFYQADEYWWQAGSKLGETGAFFDDRGYDETVGSIVVGVTVPIQDDNRVIGVFKINYKVKSILEIITKRSAQSQHIIGLVRSIGGLIVSSNPEIQHALVSHENEMLNLSDGGWWEDTHGESRFLGAHAPVTHSFSARITSGAQKGVKGETARAIKWYVISELDENIAYSSLNTFRYIAWSLAVGALLLAALLGYLLSRSITEPLSRLHKGASTFGEGNLKHRIDLQQTDEFGTLANAFDGMAGRLQETLASRDELNQEINERKRAEKESQWLRNYLQDVFNAMPSILVGVDTTGKVLHWNQEAEKRTGISQIKALDQPISEILTLIPDAIDNISRAINNSELLRIERHPYREEGEAHFAEVVIYPLTTEGIEGAVIRIDDVTERVFMEDIMVQTEKMLSVGGLAAGMAHEINNPLGGMVQGLQNIRRRLSPHLEKNIQCADEVGIDLDKVGEYLKQREIYQFMDSIADSGQRASLIVNNMLQFSRKTETGFEAVDVIEMLEKTLDLAAVDYDMKKRYDFRSIIIEREYEDALPPLNCNIGEIQQVILNLLRNAAHALYQQTNREETPTITLGAKQEGEKISISVGDNGPGMDEEICNRAFEPFFTTKPPGQGTGLGLSVSYYIIHDEHNGEIMADCSSCKGAHFTIKLPIFKDQHGVTVDS